MGFHAEARLAAVLLLCACAKEPRFPPYSGPDTCVRERTLAIPQNRFKDRVDLLFVLENTPRMALLKPSIPERMHAVLRPIHALVENGEYPDLHIGVITTDMGAGTATTDHCQPT